MMNITAPTMQPRISHIQDLSMCFGGEEGCASRYSGGSIAIDDEEACDCASAFADAVSTTGCFRTSFSSMSLAMDRWTPGVFDSTLRRGEEQIDAQY